MSRASGNGQLRVTEWSAKSNVADLEDSRHRPYKPAVEQIRYFNRHTGAFETEHVYGLGFLRIAPPMHRVALPIQ
ncbi:MAG: hypothetical protein ABIS50_08430 [Luteolibacter sp.]|uniref:hypothetical protein n=1 Tax=Luteolibacter sp. TaxID=1962973 RepID=UPI003266EA8D